MLVLDTSAYINGQRDHYPVATFPSVWELVTEAMRDGRIVPPREVFRELTAKDDDIAEWAKDRAGLFLDPSAEVQRAAGVVYQMIAEDPSFHEFASEWFDAIRGELAPGTVRAYEWQLTHHLLPFFRRHRLSEITVSEVDRYRQTKVRAGRLSGESINKTITRLGQVLEVAVERELIARNPVKVNPRRRKVRVDAPQRPWLDRADHIAALLDAAGELDARARPDRRHVPRRVILSTLCFAGLRIGELCELRWRNVDLAAGRLRVGRAKTAAGVRYVDLLPVLRDELAAWKARSARTGADDPVFATATGAAQRIDNVRSRVLKPAASLASARLEAAGEPPLPALTPHALRRTYASLAFAIGGEVPYVMAQLGHRDPKLTLTVYAHVMFRQEGERERLRALVDGASIDMDVPERAAISG